ncbi:MAG: hypothetical protein ACRELA_15860 [Candidatus Rokuibacteriota bacterium]
MIPPLEIERRYREMLLQRSGAERLKMGGSMHATARSLVRTSVLATNPQASPAEVSQALFLRFHGHELDAAALAALEGVPVAMEPRRVPVDWNDLELALTMHSDELASYLDVRTGEIRSSQVHPFGGEREDGELSEEEIEDGLADGSLIPVEPAAVVGGVRVDGGIR